MKAFYFWRKTVSDIGLIPVDWEARFDPQRMLRERLQRAKDALNNSDLDALFVFRTEDARYLTGYRHHLGPAFIMGNAVTVLSRGHDPILWTMDFEHCRLRMPWLSPDQIRMRAKEIKTQDEILCLKIANAITEAALDRAIERLRPGVKECEVLATAWETMTAMGSEWTQCSNIVCSGPATAPYRRFTSDRI